MCAIRQSGLLDNQTVARGATTLLNLSYDYAGANGKRTGQLTKILNNLDHNKDRGYSYDALGRLVQATGGPSTSPLSTQAYSYDRYGNRTSVTASGYSASLRERGSSSTVMAGAVAKAIARPSDPVVNLPTDLLAKNNIVSLPASARDAGNPVSDSAPTLRAPSLPQSGPVFTDDPLVPGVTVIKAVHITELRDAINQARARAGLPAASWAESITAGVTIIKASQIVELRTRLGEARVALGLSPASYTDPSLSAGYTVKAAHVQELRTSVREALGSLPIPPDGLATLSYDTSSNRITTVGFAYDAAGNQVRAIGPGGSSSQRFKYDAANRLVQVLADNNTTVIAAYTYGDSNERLISDEGDFRTYYASEGGTIIAEYTESGSSTTPAWSKSYVYLGEDLLSTLTPNGSGGEAVQYHHSDGLGTRLVTNPTNGTSFEQVTLPFGTALNAESTGATNRRFTTYDRSAATSLDYAVNRHYDQQQGRFTQVDPIGMDSVDLATPQTLNLYAYCTNDPINQTDANGLGFFGALWRGIKKILSNKWVALALTVAMGILLAGAAAGWWSFTKTLFISVDLGKGTVLLPFGHAISAAGWAAIGVGMATALSSVSLKNVLLNIASLGFGGFVRQLMPARGDGTPPWNPKAGTGVGPVSNFVCPKCQDALAGIIDAVIGPPPIGPFSLSQIGRRGLCKLIGGRCADEDSKTYKVAYYSSLIVGTAISSYYAAGAIRSAQEVTINGVRIAPLGNATKHPLGRFPHYHRRVLGPNGLTRAGQGIGRHRPWEGRVSDTRWWHRF